MDSQLAPHIFPSMEPKQFSTQPNLLLPPVGYPNAGGSSVQDGPTKSKRSKRNKRKRRDKRKKDNNSSQGDSKPQSNLSSDQGGPNSSMIDEDDSNSDQDTDTNSQPVQTHQKPSHAAHQQADQSPHSIDPRPSKLPLPQMCSQGGPTQPQPTSKGPTKVSPASKPATGNSPASQKSSAGRSKPITEINPRTQSVWNDPQTVISQLLQLISQKVGTPIAELHRVIAEDSRFASFVSSPSGVCLGDPQIGEIRPTPGERDNLLGCLSSTVGAEEQSDCNVTLQSNSIVGTPAPELGSRLATKKQSDGNPSTTSVQLHGKSQDNAGADDDWTDKDLFGSVSPRLDQKKPWTSTRDSQYRNDDYHRGRPSDKDIPSNRYQSRTYDSRNGYDRQDRYQPRDDKRDGGLGKRSNDQSGNQRSYPKRYQDQYDQHQHEDRARRRPKDGYRNRSRDSNESDRDRPYYSKDYHAPRYSRDQEYYGNTRLREERTDRNHPISRATEKHQSNNQSSDPRIKTPEPEFKHKNESRDAKQNQPSDELKFDPQSESRISGHPEGDLELDWNTKYSDDDLPIPPKVQVEQISSGTPEPQPKAEPGEPRGEDLVPKVSDPAAGTEGPSQIKAEEEPKLPEDSHRHSKRTNESHTTSPGRQEKQQGQHRPKRQQATYSKPLASPRPPEPVDDGENYLAFPKQSPGTALWLHTPKPQARVPSPAVSPAGQQQSALAEAAATVLCDATAPIDGLPAPTDPSPNTDVLSAVSTSVAVSKDANVDPPSHQRQAPWLSAESASIRCADTKLHNELIEFGKHVAPGPADAQTRLLVVQTFLALLREEEAKRFGDKPSPALLADVRVVAGWGLGCALNDEDVEVSLCVPSELTQAAAFAEPGKEEERYQKYQQFKKLVGQGNQADYEKPLKELCNLVIKTINSNPHLFFISTLDDVNFSGGSGKNGPSQNAPSGKRNDSKSYHLQTNLILSRRIRVNSLVHKGVTLLIHLNRLDLVMQTQEVAVQFALDFNLKYLYIALKVFAHQRFSDLACRNGLGFFQLFMLVFGAYNQVKIDILLDKNCPDIRDVKLSVLFMRMVDYLTTRFSPMSQMVSVDLRIRKTRKDIFCHKQEDGDYLDLFYPSLFGESNLGNQHMYHRFREFTLGLRNRYNFLRTLNHNHHPSILVHLVNPQYFDFDSVYLHRLRPEPAPLVLQAQP